MRTKQEIAHYQKQYWDNTKEKRRIARKKYRASNKVKEKESQTARGYRLQIRYNLSTIEYDAMLEIQKGLCAICKNPETVKNRGGKLLRLSVDHNHSTGKVRELLCRKCNTLVGMAKEDVSILNSATQYLSKHKQ